MNSDECVARICDALQSSDDESHFGQVVARLKQPFVLGDGEKWHYEGFVSMFSAVRQALARLDASISPDLPPFLLEPATIARLFGIPLADFNWQGACALGQVEGKLDLILARTEKLVNQHTATVADSGPANGSMLTKKEVASRFQISTRTLDRWRSMGIDLGEIVVGGTIRFDPTKIANIISTQKLRRRRR